MPGSIRLLAVIAVALGAMFLPTPAAADVVVTLEVPPLAELTPGSSPGGETVTLTNLRTGATHGGELSAGGQLRIEDVPPGYYQIRITGNRRYHIEYAKVDGKGDTRFDYRWRDLEAPFFRTPMGGGPDRSDAQIIAGQRDGLIATTQTGYQEGRENYISSMTRMQEIHRNALKSLESLGPKAIRAVGPPRFAQWRRSHQRAIKQVNTAYEQATSGQPATGQSAGERRAELQEKQSRLQQQHAEQTAEIARVTPAFLARRQTLLESLPETLRGNLTRGGGTDPAGHAAITRTRLQIQIETQEAEKNGTIVPADLTRLKLLYDSMAERHTARLETESEIAQTQKGIADTIIDEKDYATGGGDGGGGGGGGGN